MIFIWVVVFFFFQVTPSFLLWLSRQKRALVVRGPTDVRKKELIFMQFSCNETAQDFSAITYMIFSRFSDLADRWAQTCGAAAMTADHTLILQQILFRESAGKYLCHLKNSGGTVNLSEMQCEISLKSAPSFHALWNKSFLTALFGLLWYYCDSRMCVWPLAQSVYKCFLSL